MVIASIATGPGTRRGRATAALAGVTAILTLAGAAYFFDQRIQLLFYPTLAVLFSSSAYLAARLGGRVEYDDLLARLPEPRTMDALLSFAVVALVALTRLQPVGLHPAFYWSLPVVTLLFAVRILQSPSRLTLFQIVLFAVVIRAGIWFSAPVVGVDTRYHVAFVRFVMEAGSVPPADLSYYHWYPMAHAAGGALAELSLASAKQGIFLVGGLFACVSVAAVYLFAGAALRTVLDGDRRVQAALLAALVVAVGPWHIRRSSVVIAQSMGLATLPFALYAGFRFDRRAYAVLFALLAFVLAFTHNLTPVVLAFVLLVVVAAQRVAAVVSRYVPDWRSFGLRYGLSLVFAVGVLTVQYWIYIDYFELQVYRVVLLLFNRGVESGGGGVSLGAQLAFTIRDPFLYVGVEQLVFGAALGLFGFVALGGLGRVGAIAGDGAGGADRADGSNDADAATDGGTGEGPPTDQRIPFALFLAGFVVFLVFSMALAVGTLANVIRALPNIAIVLAPLVGFLVVRSYETRSLAVLAVVGLLVAFPVSGGVAATVGTVSPAISPTEEVGSNIYLTQPQLAATDHLLDHSSPDAAYLANDYLAGAANSRAAVRKGQAGVIPSQFAIPLMNVPPRIGVPGAVSTPNRSTVLGSLRNGSNQFYVDSRSVYPPMRPLPPSCSVVYDAGGTEVLTCPPGPGAESS